MSDFEKLVNKLEWAITGIATFGNEFWDRPQIPRSKAWEETRAALLSAIARLESERDALKEAGRWIPVEERLPEARQEVLALVKYNKKFHTEKVCYIPTRTVLAEEYLSDECDSESAEDYDGENDCYWVKEGWWESSWESDINWNISGDVTHWMPLPQPPEAISPLEDAPQKRIDELIQSVGIMATFKPTMEMNINKPVDMALEVSNYIVGLNQHISELETELAALKAENADLKQEMSDKCERCCNEHGC